MADSSTSSRARSFGSVADAYDRSRPSYPPQAAAWLTGPGRLRVLELGAGTGLLTRPLAAAGHDVLATDPSTRMLRLLRRNLPGTPAVVGTAEQIPAPSRSFDVVVCAQSFHWFDPAAALPEIARVLRPGGRLGLVWNLRDDAIPWVRRLSGLIGRSEAVSGTTDLAAPLAATAAFGPVESAQFRFWQDHTRDSLLDLVRSRSGIAVLDEQARSRVLDDVAALYDDYGRGPDGMKLPYLTRCFRSVVEHPQVDEVAALPPDPPEDTGATLIDLR